MILSGYARSIENMEIGENGQQSEVCMRWKMRAGGDLVNWTFYEWPELDRIIELHVTQLFVGQLPTNPSESHTRLLKRLDRAASAFERNRRASRIPYRRV